ncbi:MULTISPECIES: hypothetical protein [Maribacter]|uniref:Uncharacterized protein n=1 Tax=Maribacter flavus TaxID=1658664 RepID=A0ABU7IHS3_9FLAO|nr:MULTISPECIES: hypothetical protein [Maribacter]MDC6405036.1 hypothetical protein [Maribacter sp. PR66]MEE1972450.1 hypothetical protein [Maribacter flavus]
MDENLFLTRRVMDFRRAFPQLIAQWERQIGNGNLHPDLHFCLVLLDDFPWLSAYLRSLDYRIDFALNAFIVHSDLRKDFVDAAGYDRSLALEWANHELRLMYAALDHSDTVKQNPKAKVYFDICAT